MTDYPGLYWHLFYNFYPPIPDHLVIPCEEAIELCAHDEAEEQVLLPSGLTIRAGELVADLRLEELVTNRMIDLEK